MHDIIVISIIVIILLIILTSSTLQNLIIKKLEDKQKRKLSKELSNSIKNKEFIIYIQPKFDTQTSELVGAEALIRKKLPNGEILPPNKFVPLYEKYGVITKLDMYVLEEICKKQKEWRNKNLKLIPISINESRHHLKNSNHLQELNNIISKYDTNTNLIELEMTESTVVENMEIAKQAEENVHKMGFIVSMDDFGTGYSAFNILKNIKIDVLKIDKSFFDDMINNAKAQIIIETIVSMCKKLDIITVAEGIETKEQVEFLKKINCDRIQGYYFSKPIPIELFEKTYLQKKIKYYI